MTDKIPLLDRTTPLAWRYEKGNKAFVHKSRLKEGGRAYYGLGYTETPLYAADPDLARKAASADRFESALKAIQSLGGNVDHDNPGGPNDAAMRGSLLMTAKELASQALTEHRSQS
jgi:hypothetical protein